MALFNDAMFAPQSGIPGWLGDILKMAQANPEMSQGFQQPAPMPQPRPEMELPQNAQPAQGGPLQPQQQMSQQRFMGPGGSLQGSLFQIAGALNPNLRHLAQDAQTQQKTAMAAQYLASRGLDPAMAQLVATNPAALGSYLTNQLGGGDKTSDIKEYQFAKEQGFKGTFQDWIANKRAGAGEYGLQPVWGRDAEGNPVMLQAGKSGEAIRSKIPEGVTLSGKDAIKLDAGTHWVLMDPLTRQQVGIIPKQLKEAEAQKASGEEEGKARAALPHAQATVERINSQIDNLINDPELPSALGFFEGKLPKEWAGEKRSAVIGKIEQLSGGAFLQARQDLKGGGAITDFESSKAEAAYNRMSRSLSPDEFKSALREFKHYVGEGYKKLQQKAGSSPAAPANNNDPLGLR